MSNNYAPCFYRIDFVVIPFNIELPWSKQARIAINLQQSYDHNLEKTLICLKDDKVFGAH